MYGNAKKMATRTSNAITFRMGSKSNRNDRGLLDGMRGCFAAGSAPFSFGA